MQPPEVILSRFLKMPYERVEPDLRQTNPTWTHPRNGATVTCYIIGERKLDAVKGFWDDKDVTWRRVSGEAIKILGWV